MSLRSIAAVTMLALAACGIDVTTLSQPDLVMRDARVQPNECMNGFTDGEETDLDCGGSSCTPCDTGKSCKKGRDCASTFCTNSVCDAPSCMDGVKNGAESDQDCGGSCTGCAVGKVCSAGTDCASMTCTNGMCAASPCTNLKQDGAETDVDCGGGTCLACGDGKMCQLGTDCRSVICTNNLCGSAGNCMDKTQNGMETDLDCGGPNCPTCADGKMCAKPGDCVGGVCTNNLCKSNGVDYGPMHTFLQMTADFYVSTGQGNCSVGNAAADAAYFCASFYPNKNCVARQGYKAAQIPANALTVRMFRPAGCDNLHGAPIPGTACDGLDCRIGSWKEPNPLNGLNNLICHCP